MYKGTEGKAIARNTVKASPKVDGMWKVQEVGHGLGR
jgi:hypothetical protein